MSFYKRDWLEEDRQRVMDMERLAKLIDTYRKLDMYRSGDRYLEITIR